MAVFSISLGGCMTLLVDMVLSSGGHRLEVDLMILRFIVIIQIAISLDDQ